MIWLIPIVITHKASANITIPMTTTRLSHSGERQSILSSFLVTALSGGGGSRRMRDGRAAPFISTVFLAEFDFLLTRAPLAAGPYRLVTSRRRVGFTPRQPCACEKSRMERRAIMLAIAAIPLGIAGGYAWSSAMAPPPQAAKPPEATFGPIPASPEELLGIEDVEWSTRSADPTTEQGQVAATAAGTVAADIHYSGCTAVRAAGKAPLYRGDPGYSEDMDGDDDGIACEPIRSR